MLLATGGERADPANCVRVKETYRALGCERANCTEGLVLWAMKELTLQALDGEFSVKKTPPTNFVHGLAHVRAKGSELWYGHLPWALWYCIITGIKFHLNNCGILQLIKKSVSYSVVASSTMTCMYRHFSESGHTAIIVTVATTAEKNRVHRI